MFDQTCDILLIDDDVDILDAYSDLLQQEGYNVLALHNPDITLLTISKNWRGIILCDVLLPQISGLDLLDFFLQQDDQLLVIMITGHGDVPMAVEALKKGAFDFLEKPIAPEKLLQQVKKASAIRHNIVAKREWQFKTLDEQFIGKSEWNKHLKIQLQKLSLSHIPIFIWGETGTGRQLAATCLHHLNRDKQSLPPIIYECMLGKDNDVLKLIEQAKNGTLILKNIHLLTPAEQLLIANLQNNDQTSFRLIIVSNCHLTEYIKTQKIVPELYYLFSHTQIHMLPLRERENDIPEIFIHYLQKSAKRLNIETPKVKASFLNKLKKKDWAGNIRELINAAQLHVIGLLSTHLTIDRLVQNDIPLDQQLANYEKILIENALNIYNGKINDVAIYLGIPRKKLYLRMRKYGLDKLNYKE